MALITITTACAQGESLDLTPESANDAVASPPLDRSTVESGAADTDAHPAGSSNRSLPNGDAAGVEDAPDEHAPAAADSGTSTPPNASFAPDGSMSLAPQTGVPSEAGVVDAGAADVLSEAAPIRPDGGITDPNHENWTARASSISWCCDSITGAFDGNIATRWSSGKGQSGDEWFELDMGQVFGISEVWLDAHGADFPVAYDLAISIDGSQFTSVATGAGAELTKIQFAYRSARYVRIRQTGKDADHWWSIYELTVKG